MSPLGPVGLVNPLGLGMPCGPMGPVAPVDPPPVKLGIILI